LREQLLLSLKVPRFSRYPWASPWYSALRVNKKELVYIKFRFTAKIEKVLFVTPGFLIALVIVVPFSISIFLSFTNYSLRRPAYEFVFFQNWIKMFTSVEFWHSCYVTGTYAFLSTFFEMVFGLGIALLLVNINNFLTRIVRTIIIFPLIIAPVIGTIIWHLMVNTSVGIMERGLNLVGIYGFPWMASHSTAMFTAVLIDFWIYCPFVILLTIAGLQSLPITPFEAAKIDGASGWVLFKEITLPLLKPTLLIALVFKLMLALCEYGIIFALTKGGPGDTLMNLSITAYNIGLAFQELGRALPYILILWVFNFVVARKIVKMWTIAQSIALGTEV